MLRCAKEWKGRVSISQNNHAAGFDRGGLLWVAIYGQESSAPLARQNQKN